MTRAVLLAALLAVVTSSSGIAQQRTPGPDVAPTGEFTAAPPAGPIGTVVTLTGHLDQPISWIRLYCTYPSDPLTQSGEALRDVYPSQPAPDFSVQFEIPAELLVRQARPGEPAAVEPRPDFRCEFRAISWHQLLYISAPFSITAELPATGSGPPSDISLVPALALLLGGLLTMGGALGLRKLGF